ncbi:MAG TPA: M20/M25/M40 family metallo-hydrolase [Caulobacteraceae bacterium]|jgi:hypothetical protein|nr:M20/M25/M40 family metallo-hydrolase [Caulobacteraceae bacterium]
MRWLALALTLVLGLALAWLDIRVPDPVGPGAASTVFSSARAFRDIDEMGKAPHPVDSVQHDQVRDYLISRLKGLGLETRVQDGRAFHEIDAGGRQIVMGADVQNLIGVLPGKDRSLRPLAIMAHYDSVPGSPGAADDAAGVAVALEVARAIKAQGPPERDVDLIITDGEESGLVGAHAFFNDDPLAKQIGFVINMDTRGSGGRTFMFQTAAGDGQTLDLFRKTAVDPRANSLAVFIYEHMPNDTDFTVSRKAGIQGLNYAFMGREFDYHSPSATPARTQPGAIQDLGRQVLAPAQAVAFSKVLPGKAPDKVFGDLYGRVVVAYPPVVGWLVLLVGLAFFTVAVVRVRQKGEIGWIETTRAFSGAVALLFFTAALCSFVRDATLVPHGFVDQLPLLARFGRFEAALAFAALGGALVGIGALLQGQRRLWGLIVPVVLGAACYLIGKDLIGAGAGVLTALFAAPALGRPVRPWSAVAGFLKLGFLIAILLQLFAAPAAFVLEWPLVLICAGVLVASFTGGLDRPAAQIACGVAAVLFLGWGLGQLHMLALGVGADLPAALGPFFWVAAVALAPLIVTTPRPMLLGALAFGACIGVLISTIADNPATTRYPRATELMYVHDADTGRYYRASLLNKLDPWTEQALKADGGTVHKTKLMPLTQDAVFVTDAPKVSVTTRPPVLAVDHASGNAAHYSITLPQIGPQRVMLAIKSNAPLSLTVAGMPLSKQVKPGAWMILVWAHPPGDDGPPGVKVEFDAPTDAKLDMKYALVTPGWPAQAKPLPPRPGNVMAYAASDSTAEVGSLATGH